MDLIPWRGRRRRGLQRSVPAGTYQDPWAMMRRMNELFDSFVDPYYQGTGEVLPAFGSIPVDVREDPESVEVHAELPGMKAEDIDVRLQRDDVLQLRGEKRTEVEERGDGTYCCERSYGTFQRLIPLPSEVREDQVEARYTDGVLRIKLAKKTPSEPTRKRIQIQE